MKNSSNPPDGGVLFSMSLTSSKGMDISAAWALLLELEALRLKYSIELPLRLTASLDTQGK